MAKENLIAKGVRVPQEMWDMCDTMTEKTSESSRNEFIRRAVEFYIEYLNHERSDFSYESLPRRASSASKK